MSDDRSAIPLHARGMPQQQWYLPEARIMNLVTTAMQGRTVWRCIVHLGCLDARKLIVILHYKRLQTRTQPGWTFRSKPDMRRGTAAQTSIVIRVHTGASLPCASRFLRLARRPAKPSRPIVSSPSAPDSSSSPSSSPEGPRSLLRR